MTTATIPPADQLTRDAVLQQLMWDSRVDASDIGITAHDAAVTLSGFVDTYAGKLAAERAAKRVHGVRAVANEIQVRVRYERTDDEIARDAARALELRATLPGTVQAVVHSGHITLTGEVPTLFDRVAAEKAVRHLRGLKGIANHITVTPAATARDVQREIARALHRDASLHGRGIEVTVVEHAVQLRGEVASWREREAAERAAMHAPGITAVDNQLSVAWPAVDAVEE